MARGGRGIPRIAGIAVALIAIGIASVLVGLAWKSNRAARSDAVQPRTFADGTAQDGDAFVGCTDCHQDLDKVFELGLRPKLLYRHEVHFAKGVSDCSVCHPSQTHEPDKVNRPTMARCFTCHGTTARAIAPGDCSTCHPPGMPEQPTSHQAETWARVEHADVARDDQFQCLVCHQQNFCASCHEIPMPHPKDWTEDEHVGAFFDRGEQVCQICHDRGVVARDFCDSCHHPQGPNRIAWRDFHPNVVREGSGTCFECHNPTTCATCHVRGRETFEADENWSSDADGHSPDPQTEVP